MCKKASQDFWDRWSREYLQHLQKATKWHKKNRNFTVGDLVMLTDGNEFLCQWTMAKVVKVYPGADGLVRAVDVQLEKRVIPKIFSSKEKLIQQIKTKTSGQSLNWPCCWQWTRCSGFGQTTVPARPD